jgi:hypothetical protein
VTSPRNAWFMAVATVFLASCATNDPVTALKPSVSLHNGPNLQILSAYLVAHSGHAVVRGRVRATPGTFSPIYGHLDVTAFGPDGLVLSQRGGRWSGQIGGRQGIITFYEVDLGPVRPDQIRRLDVTYRSGSHNARVEGFK